ncbi:hypothetical protein KR044_006794, partial [Drosophila immigrans]
HPMSHSALRILYGLTLLLLLQLLNYGLAAPDRLNLISESQSGSDYITRVMRHAKAAEIASYMKETLDPCDNFYEFACGNWRRINEASSSKLRTGLFDRLGEALHRKVKHMLDNENEQLDTEEDKQVRNFYRSCMKVTAIDESYRSKLKELIAKFGAMPALEGRNWKESEFDWIETIGQIAFTYGQIIIMGAGVAADLVNNTVNMVYITGQTFPLEVRGLYVNNHTKIYRTNHRNLMAKKLSNYLGIEKTLALSTATELLDFEIELAKGLNNETEVLDYAEASKLTTIEEMQRLYAPTLDIQRLVNLTLDEEIDDVYDLLPQYKVNLVEVMKRTPKRIVANYIFYRLLEKFMLEVGATKAKRERICHSKTKKFFADNLDNMVYRRHYNADSSADVELIWSELQQIFMQKLQSNTSLPWISPQTRELAIEKLAAMTLEVNSYADEDLSSYFEDVHLSEQDYIGNLLQMYENAAETERDQINEPATPSEPGDVLSFTPANLLMQNKIKVPVSLLQPYYLWAASYPNAIKFGTLAALIGHELIHGFDINGRKFDANGNLDDWWDETSSDNFAIRQQCFKKQYSNYSYFGKKLPETDEQSENIADNGGVRLAFDAYRRWLESSVNYPDVRHYQKEMLPTLNYTSMQLFFISYAQVWCNDVHPGVRKFQVATDDHVPGKLRVIGPLSNFDEFSREFHCAVGTQMNPAHKCELY